MLCIVLVKGTTIGAATDLDGNYTLRDVPSYSKILVFSSVGLKTREVDIAASNNIDLVMEVDALRLNEVVVTALGITQEKKALSYATQTVEGDELNQSGSGNVLNELSGKVSGLNVISNAGDPGAGTYINLRGPRLLTGDNQPLMVVDGIPIDNSINSYNPGNAGNPSSGANGESLAGVPNDNRGIDINPNDIATITVLKGPAATALYGIQAASGALIITTKKGGGIGNNGPSVTFSSSTGWTSANKLPGLQNTYAQGSNGVYAGPTSDNRFSWGPPISTLSWDGNANVLDQHGNIVPNGSPTAKIPVTAYKMTQADAKGYNAYSGIARILMAYSLQITVDEWGDMPYSQALQGVSNLYPAYDKASGLYTTIGGLVDAGIADLSNSSAGGMTPGAEDIIYGGNVTNWIKLGHAVKARLAIHQSKNNAAMATTALSEIGQSFAGNADNAQYGFGTTANSANPWYQFESARGGYVSFKSSTLASMLSARNDPRYAIYIDSAKDALAAYYGSINSPVELICYDELQFVAAEANLRIGNAAGAQTAFKAAIKANMTKLGVDTTSINAYVAAHGTLPLAVADAIDSVSIQEYLALYLNPEAYTLWRRTNSPVLIATNGNNGVARRFLYPETEYLLNTANVTAEGNVTLWAPKLFWDN